MQDKLKRLFKDPRGILLRKIETSRLKWYSRLSSLTVELLCTLRDVHIGKECLFYGVPIFRRVPLSQISIGNQCVFRSDFTSNLVGVNRKCIIATHRENAKITIGNNSGFSGTVIGAAISIFIGSNVQCGANVLITDFDWHNIHPDSRKKPAENFKPVVIEDNVWLGINSVVLKGVRIGANTLCASINETLTH